jgi:hypothetical protein
MDVLKKLSKQINLQFYLSSQVVNSRILKIKFNFFIYKNVEVTDGNFKIYDSYLFGTISPFFSIFSYDYSKKCKSVDKVCLPKIG